MFGVSLLTVPLAVIGAVAAACWLVEVVPSGQVAQRSHSFAGARAAVITFDAL